MSVINGTITGVTELQAKLNTGRKAFLVTATFAAYTGSSDTATITAAGAGIKAHMRDGRTYTVRGAIPILAGLDTNSQDVYFTGTAVQAATVATDDLTGQLSDNTGTELTTATASKGVGLCVIVDIT